uniref:Uncharacterized protein n=1 Tax=Propithecus coquereli TaxID=379532 RepID=A0A2K6ES37_PROCO
MYRELNSIHLTQFSGKFFSLCLFQLVTADLIVFVVVIGPDIFHQLSQTSFVCRVNLHEGDSGIGLPVD